MKNIIVKRFGDKKGTIIENLKKLQNIHIVGYTDKNTELWGNYEAGYCIYSIYKVIELYKSGQVDGIVFSGKIEMKLLDKMIKEVYNLGMKEEDVLIARPEFCCEEPKWSDLCTYSEYRRIPYIEFHVADHCNLNCKGCVHFSPLVKEIKFPNYEEVKADIFQLKKVVEYIDDINILGGEPFLNEDLDKYIELVREVYPFSKITIVTNGLLLMKIKDRHVESIKHNNAKIRISAYPPILNKLDEIISYTKTLGIEVSCSEPISHFSYTFDASGGHAKGAQRMNCTCPNLYEGHLAVCPPIAYLRYFNDYFDKDWDMQDGMIDIYDESLTYSKLLVELHKVRKLCDYCLFISEEDMISKKWEQSKDINLSDYVIEK